MSKKIVPYENLLGAPIKRAAYSDRTAWLMATMSSLAYVRFEDSQPVTAALFDVMKLITGKEDPEDQEKTKKLPQTIPKHKLENILKSIQGSGQRPNNKKELESDLASLKFELVKTVSVSIPLIADTQAFVAKLTADGRDPFIVLSFRGTEPRKPADIKADLEATTHTLGSIGGPGGNIFIEAGKETGLQKTWPKIEVHSGFWKAFSEVKDELENILADDELKDLPLYITGHSLGGALAIVATYALESDHVAACYTFGGPRVGNMHFGRRIKPPIYRVVNAADIVARLPPGPIIDVLTVVMRALPIVPYLDKIADFLERFRGYRHYGDMRYLTAASQEDSDGGPPQFSNLIVHSNPAQILRWFWVARRYLATRGKAAAGDHNITTYTDKLAYWANVRSRK